MKSKLGRIAFIVTFALIIGLFCMNASASSTDHLTNNLKKVAALGEKIPESAKDLSTEELIYAALDTDIVISLMCTNTTVEDMYNSIKYYFPVLAELETRTDVASTLVDIYIESGESLSSLQKHGVGLLLTQTEYSDALTEGDYQKLSTYAQAKTAETSAMDENTASPASIIDDLLAALFPSNVSYQIADVDVTTVGGNEVTLYEADGELTNAEINSVNSDIQNQFPNITTLANPTARYNCHSYAWYDNSTSNGYWIYDCQPYTYDTHISCTVSDTATVGAICVYFNSQGIVHSAIVESVSGNTVTVISKWGACGLYRHSVDEVPSGYTYNGTATRCRYFTFTDTHTYSGDYTQYSSTQHSRKCAHCDSVNYYNHTLKYTTNALKHTGTCSLCGYTFTAAHTYNSVTGACKVCGYVKDVGAVNKTPADSSEASIEQTCTDCS